MGANLNTQNLALGTDVSCTTDLDGAGRMVSGRQCLAEALVRRWSTPRGQLIDDPNYGYAVGDELNDDVGPADLVRIQANMQSEALKDERVLAAQVTVPPLTPAGDLVVTAVITDSQGPFTLVLSVSQVTTTLLAVK